MSHRRATFLSIWFFAVAGCGQPAAPQQGPAPGRAGKGDTAWAVDVKNLEGLPGKYSRTDGAPGELAGLEIGATTVPHPMLAPLGTLTASCTAQEVCAPGAACAPAQGQCAAIMRHPSADVSALVVQAGSDTRGYVIQSLERDKAHTVVRLTLVRVSDPQTLADPQPPIVLEREGYTAPQPITTIADLKGLGGSYVAPAAPGVELARLELALPDDVYDPCGIFHRWVFPPSCEGDQCARLERGTYRASPASAGTSPSPARLFLDEPDGTTTRTYVIQEQLRSASGNVTRMVLREELAGRLGAPLVLERSYPEVPVTSAVTSLDGLAGYYERDDPAPESTLMQLDLGEMTTGQGSYASMKAKSCTLERYASSGTYRAIPEGPMTGFASLSLVGQWGYAETYIIDAIDRDSAGTVQRIVLRHVGSDMTDPALEPWIAMRRLP